MTFRCRLQLPAVHTWQAQADWPTFYTTVYISGGGRDEFCTISSQRHIFTQNKDAQKRAVLIDIYCNLRNIIPLIYERRKLLFFSLKDQKCFPMCFLQPSSFCIYTQSLASTPTYVWFLVPPSAPLNRSSHPATQRLNLNAQRL